MFGVFYIGMISGIGKQSQMSVSLCRAYVCAGLLVDLPIVLIW